MIQFDLPKQKSSIIKVLGVGGGGSNAVNFMFQQDIEGVDFIICNTDSKAIEQSPVPNKIQLGPHLTQGLGAGANPSIGRQATEESLEEIKSVGWFSKDELQSLGVRTEKYINKEILEEDWQDNPGLEPVMYDWFKDLDII